MSNSGTLIGARAEALTTLQSLAKELGLDERTQFLVDLPHSQVAAQLASADVFVLPSRQEPFGIVLLEAGALAIPVVATRVGGIPEVVRDGETGMLVPPDNSVALAKAIATTLAAPDAARRRAAAMRLRVETHFTWARAYRDYASLLCR